MGRIADELLLYHTAVVKGRAKSVEPTSLNGRAMNRVVLEFSDHGNTSSRRSISAIIDHQTGLTLREEALEPKATVIRDTNYSKIEYLSRPVPAEVFQFQPPPGVQTEEYIESVGGRLIPPTQFTPLQVRG
jgi:hypothetical protein